MGCMRGKGLVNALTDFCSCILLAVLQSGCRSLCHRLIISQWLQGTINYKEYCQNGKLYFISMLQYPNQYRVCKWLHLRFQKLYSTFRYFPLIVRKWAGLWGYSVHLPCKKRDWLLTVNTALMHILNCDPISTQKPPPLFTGRSCKLRYSNFTYCHH